MTEDRREHWQNVYATKDAGEVSWFQSHPSASLKSLEAIGATPSDALIDIGGGRSVLAGALVDARWSDLSVLDISSEALAKSQASLGVKAGDIEWICADITQWRPTRDYAIWHDRAAFHFLTDPEDRKRYKSAMARALDAGGHAIIASFAPDGPEKCSALQVQRYSATELSAELGEDYQLVQCWDELHSTPWGASQSFQWSVFHKEPS